MIQQDPNCSLSFVLGDQDETSNHNSQQTRINNNTITLLGRSVAGQGTCFAVPELGSLLLDCGVAVTDKTPSAVLLSHTHSDHVQDLSRLIHAVEDRRRNQGSSSKKQQPLSNATVLPVYLPKSALPYVKEYLQAYQRMVSYTATTTPREEEDDTESLPPCYELRPIEAGQEFSICLDKNKNKKQNKEDPFCSHELIVRVVKCTHRIDCVGYSIFRQRRQKRSQLRPEHVGLPSSEIAKLHQQGIPVTTTTIVEDPLQPVLCFLGDTQVAALQEHAEILQQHRVVVVECTFLQDTQADQDRADASQHMHWQRDLRPIVEAHPQVLFVLIHFRVSDTALDIRRCFVHHKNVHAMILQSDVEEQWTRHAELREPGETTAPTCPCRFCSGADKEDTLKDPHKEDSGLS